jgi:hypothetical protein
VDIGDNGAVAIANALANGVEALTTIYFTNCGFGAVGQWTLLLSTLPLPFSLPSLFLSPLHSLAFFLLFSLHSLHLSLSLHFTLFALHSLSFSRLFPLLDLFIRSRFIVFPSSYCLTLTQLQHPPACAPLPNQ